MSLLSLVRVWRADKPDRLESHSIWVNPAHIRYLTEAELYDPAYECKVRVSHIHWASAAPDTTVTTVLESPEYIMEAMNAKVA